MDGVGLMRGVYPKARQVRQGGQTRRPSRHPRLEAYRGTGREQFQAIARNFLRFCVDQEHTQPCRCLGAIFTSVMLPERAQPSTVVRHGAWSLPPPPTEPPADPRGSRKIKFPISVLLMYVPATFSFFSAIIFTTWSLQNSRLEFSWPSVTTASMTRAGRSSSFISAIHCSKSLMPRPIASKNGVAARGT